MKTLNKTAFALLLAAGAAGPTFAETAANTPPTNNGQTTPSEPGMTLRQQVQNDLAKAGYTDIRVMPESFLVRAKDPKGNAVMMLINPDSLTEVTTMSPNNKEPVTNKPSASEKMTGDTTVSTTPPAGPDTSTSEKMTGGATSSTAPAKQ